MPFEKTDRRACASAWSTGSTSSTRPSPQRKQSRLDLVVAGSKDGIVMVEAGANEVTEEEAMQALETGARRDQADRRARSTRWPGKPAGRSWPKPEVKVDADVPAAWSRARRSAPLTEAMRIKGKLENYGTRRRGR